MLTSDFQVHLWDRSHGCHPNFMNYLLHWADEEKEVVTFPLWTTYGALVGYQRYSWKQDKLRNNAEEGRYYTYRRKDLPIVWGLDLIKLSNPKPLYVVEGIWDAISVQATGKDCVAVLSNNPKFLKHWFSTLPREVVALCEGDRAGRMLSRCCDRAIYLPEGQDPNSMDLQELKELLL